MPPSSMALRSLWVSSRSSILSSTPATRYATRVSLPQRPLTTSRPILAVNNSNNDHPPSSTLSQDTASETATEEEPTPSPSTPTDVFPSNITLPPLRQYPYAVKVGTVTSVGLMEKTVRVAYHHRKWDRHIRKWYPKVTTYLVSDPQNSLREGDVIEFSSGARKSPRVRHVVDKIIAPFGEGIDQRPPVLTREQREELDVERRKTKISRRMERAASEAVEQDGEVLQGEEIEGQKRRVLERQFHVGRIKRLVEERVNTSAVAS